MDGTDESTAPEGVLSNARSIEAGCQGSSQRYAPECSIGFGWCARLQGAESDETHVTVSISRDYSLSEMASGNRLTGALCGMGLRGPSQIAKRHTTALTTIARSKTWRNARDTLVECRWMSVWPFRYDQQPIPPTPSEKRELRNDLTQQPCPVRFPRQKFPKLTHRRRLAWLASHRPNVPVTTVLR